MSAREILFRGKRISDNSWVYGGIYPTFHPNFPQGSEEIVLSERNNNCYAICANGKDVYVYQETIGQYTGLTDENGKKIFEGDIVKYPIEQGKYSETNIHEVVFEMRGGSGYFGIKMSDVETWGFCPEVPSKLMTVFGNIHDNPELLEVE
ncbi:MAG: hypothetical protein IJT79_08440 [Ruminococcus sp.]|nr:hypothetical protein [Ruminococcus sp.]